MKTGFYLTRLALIGTGVPDAEIEFSTGLNVISGPSDTGKTFIAQCIDYMFGAKERPKEIPEARSYESIVLGLKSWQNENEFVLRRSLRGGDLVLSVEDREETLGAKHDKDTEGTVSGFLLNLSGLAHKKVRVDKHGRTRALSFRDLARLILIDEETIITDRSPIFSGQHLSRTVETSVFRLLLSGVDDSSVIATEDPKITRSRQEGKAEVIGVLIERAREQLAELQTHGDQVSLRGELRRIEEYIQQASSEVTIGQDTVSGLEEKRRDAWTNLRQIESHAEVLSELFGRFELLEKQYSSDLRRLEAIAEVGMRLGQLKEERCPVCGALAEHHDAEHRSSYTTLGDVTNACRVEADKIRTLLTDLKSTAGQNTTEAERINKQRTMLRAEFESITHELRSSLQPHLKAALQRLKDNQEKREIYRNALGLYERVDELQQMLSEAKISQRIERTRGISMAVGADEAEQFSQDVEALLRAWHFPDLDRVTFSEENQDIVISGRMRASHGKGVRAITHAAFNLALLRYCHSRSMPHPGLVVVDSPLVVYREPDTDEGGFSPDLKNAFYRSLAAGFRSSQVIIIENEDPPRDITGSAQVTRFTGTERGRGGFIPKTRR